MNVLVTGGLGVNGSWVTRQLADAGLKVCVLDIRPDFSLLGHSYRDRVEVVTGDIRDQSLIDGLLTAREITGVVHMAAAVGHGAVDPDPKLSFDLNAAATVMLLDAARRCGVRRFVFASSRAVYGDITGEHAHPHYRPIPETYPAQPTKLYDLMKLLCEGVGRGFADSFGLEFVALRFATIFGPGKTARHKSFGLLSRIIEGPANGQAVIVERGGDQRDDMIFAEDAARGVVAALLTTVPRHSVYNICTGRGHTLHELADAVRHHVPGAEIRVGAGLNYFGIGPNYSGLLDGTRAHEDFGFEVADDLSGAVDRYYRAMRDLGLH